MSILFSNANIITMNKNSTTLKNANLMVDGDKISYVGYVRPDDIPERVIDCRGGILMPGLVNAHTHSPMSLLRGLKDDCTLDTWLNEVIWPIEGRMTREDIYWGSLLSVAEMIAYGTVSFSDMYRCSDTVARAISKTGVKANICESITCPEGADPVGLEQVRESEEMVKKWNGYGDGLIRCDTSIQSVFQTTPKLWEHIARFAADANIGIHIHLSETEAEQQGCLEKYGVTPAAALKRHGVFCSRVVGVHGTFLSPEDIATLAGSRASVVHDPASNLKTCCVTARLKPFVDAGLNVALGSDGVCSNNSADLFETMKQTALLQKAFEKDPEWMSAEQVLGMAMTGGWASQGRSGESGCLAPGYDADIVLLQADHPGLLPSPNPMNTVVYSAQGGHVRLTMVRGRVLYEDGSFCTIDMEKVKYHIDNFN